MKVLDATFIIDYLDGVEATRTFYERNGGADVRWVIPVPAYAEVLVGVGNLPDGDVLGTRAALEWGEVYTVDESAAVLAAEIAGEIAPGGPYLDAVDALVAAVGRELQVPVVSADRDLTHEGTKAVVEVEEYR